MKRIMKLLIVGDAVDEFLCGFAEELSIFQPGVVIDVLNINDKTSSNLQAKNNPFFRKVYTYSPDIYFLKHIPKLRGIAYSLLRKAEDLKIKENYDAVLLFGLWPKSIIFFKSNFKKFRYVVGAIMGSDLLNNQSYRDYNGWLFTIGSCHKIIVGNPQLKDKLISEKLVPPDKIELAYYGSRVMELINDLPYTNQEAKRLFRFPEDKIVITCGYNAKSRQQHLLFIEEIKKIQTDKSRVLLVFPLTYGREENYLNQLRDAVRTSGFEYVLIEDFLSAERVAILRKATDIFVHIQQTDAFSGSMQESLLSGNIVINGTWLPYKELKDRGVKFLEISKVSEIPSLIDNIIRNPDEYREKYVTSNTQEKFQTALWKNNISTWYKILSGEN